MYVMYMNPFSGHEFILRRFAIANDEYCTGELLAKIRIQS